MAKAVVRRKKALVKRLWTKDDIRTLKSMARKEPLARIARSLKRTEGATRHKATMIGVSLSMIPKKRKTAKR